VDLSNVFQIHAFLLKPSSFFISPPKSSTDFSHIFSTYLSSSFGGTAYKGNITLYYTELDLYYTEFLSPEFKVKVNKLLVFPIFTTGFFLKT